MGALVHLVTTSLLEMYVDVSAVFAKTSLQPITEILMIVGFLQSALRIVNATARL